MSMKIWYLHHSGFFVETASHLLVFDYYTNTPLGGTLDQGVVTPALLSKDNLSKDKKLCVFVSHSHYDHYNPVVHRWQQERPDMLLFLGEDIPPRGDAVTIKSGETVTLPGIEVMGLRSTDQGVAFLVKVDGKVVYHGGDLNWWHWDGEPDSFNDAMSTAYRSEVDKLVGQQIDLAFLPVDPRLGRGACWGAQYFMNTVGAAVMVPMHCWDDYTVCDLLINDPDSKGFRDKVVPLSTRGQSFYLPEQS